MKYVIVRRDPIAFGMSRMVGPFDTPEQAYEYNARHLPLGTSDDDDGYIYLMAMQTPIESLADRNRED